MAELLKLYDSRLLSVILSVFLHKYLFCAFVLCVFPETEPKDAGSEKSSGVVRLNTIRQIIEQV